MDTMVQSARQLSSGGNTCWPVRCPGIVRWKIGALLSAAVILVFLQWAGLARAAAGERILFLRLALTNDTVSLLSASSQPGHIKAAPLACANHLHFEVLASSGEVLWTGAVPDPLLRELESESPERPGSLRRMGVRSSEAEFTIRIPLADGLERIRFYRLEPVPHGPPAAPPVRKPLNALVLFGPPVPGQ